MEKTLTISAKRISTKNGNSFLKFSTQINGVWYRVKFNKSAGAQPDVAGRYEFVVDTSALSIQKGHTFTGKDGNPMQENDTIWIKKYNSARKYTTEELMKEQIASVAAIFGDEEQLPF